MLTELWCSFLVGTTVAAMRLGRWPGPSSIRERIDTRWTVPGLVVMASRPRSAAESQAAGSRSAQVERSFHGKPADRALGRRGQARVADSSGSV